MRLSFGVKQLLFLMLLLASSLLCAQEFHLIGTCSQPLRGRLSLIIYDGDTTYRVLRSTVRGSEFAFSGIVRQPVLAQLFHKDLPQPLSFYLENSEITITLDVNNPNASPVQGSRSNSQYRFALENCQDPIHLDCLKRWIQSNTTSIFAPFILCDHWVEDYDVVSGLFQQLQGDAVHTYHYHQLSRRLKALQAVTEGQKMPDILLPDTLGTSSHLDSLRSDSTYTLIAIGATWCDQCQRIEKQLKNAEYSKTVTPVIIHIDSHNQGWNAPFLQQLSVDHIPYLILLDKDGIIRFRDIRLWQLPRLLKE